MLLINTKTRRLEDFRLKQLPKYAILSHRWQDNEISFNDIQMTGTSHVNLLRGSKIDRFCAVAAEDGFDYVWVDTCCIDKGSSAELSEAVNSMFRIYRHSARCYVYLYDVDSLWSLHKSEWFERGWTLQELLAPSEVHFFNQDWVFLSDKQSILYDLQHITGIPTKALLNFQRSDYCIAELMSWSKSRKTSREEDLAYCLLGIFDINMPLIYAEGSKAFQRLQEVIMDNSTDLTLFLWQGQACEKFGMLAASPSCFDSDKLRFRSSTATEWMHHLAEGWYKNNAGIQLNLWLVPYCVTKDHRRIFKALLSAPEDYRRAFKGPVIFLEAIKRLNGNLLCRRCMIDGKATAELESSSLNEVLLIQKMGPLDATKTLIMRKPMTAYASKGYHELGVSFMVPQDPIILIKTRPACGSRWVDQLKCWPGQASKWSEYVGHTFPSELTDLVGVIACIVIIFPSGLDLTIFLGFDENLRWFCLVGPYCRDIVIETCRVANITRAFKQLLQDDDGPAYAFHKLSGLHALASSGGIFYPRRLLYNGTMSLTLERGHLCVGVSRFSGFEDQCSKYTSDASVSAKRELFGI